RSRKNSNGGFFCLGCLPRRMTVFSIQLWLHLFLTVFNSMSFFRRGSPISPRPTAKLSFASKPKTAAAIEHPPQCSCLIAPQAVLVLLLCDTKRAIQDDLGQQILDRRVNLQNGSPHQVIPLVL